MDMDSRHLGVRNIEWVKYLWTWIVGTTWAKGKGKRRMDKMK